MCGAIKRPIGWCARARAAPARTHAPARPGGCRCVLRGHLRAQIPNPTGLAAFPDANDGRLFIACPDESAIFVLRTRTGGASRLDLSGLEPREPTWPVDLTIRYRGEPVRENPRISISSMSRSSVRVRILEERLNDRRTEL